MVLISSIIVDQICKVNYNDLLSILVVFLSLLENDNKTFKKYKSNRLATEFFNAITNCSLVCRRVRLSPCFSYYKTKSNLYCMRIAEPIICLWFAKNVMYGGSE